MARFLVRISLATVLAAAVVALVAATPVAAEQSAPSPTGGLGPATTIYNPPALTPPPPAAAPGHGRIQSGVLGLSTPSTGGGDTTPLSPLGFILVLSGAVLVWRTVRSSGKPV